MYMLKSEESILVTKNNNGDNKIIKFKTQDGQNNFDDNHQDLNITSIHL